MSSVFPSSGSRSVRLQLNYETLCEYEVGILYSTLVCQPVFIFVILHLIRYISFYIHVCTMSLYVWTNVSTIFLILFVEKTQYFKWSYY